MIIITKTKNKKVRKFLRPEIAKCLIFKEVRSSAKVLDPNQVPVYD